jgi:hypothetical protein
MSFYRQEFHCSCRFKGPWPRNDEKLEGSWKRSNGISTCVYVFIVFNFVPHVRTPICWELWRNFNACWVIIIMFDDMWRCYGTLCQTHENVCECWTLWSFVSRFCYLFIDVRIFGCMLVKLFCICVTSEVWEFIFSMLLIWGVGSFMGVLWYVVIRKWLVKPMELTENEIR